VQLLLVVATFALAAIPAPAWASTPATVTAESFTVVQGGTAPLGDVAIEESAIGQLTVSDVVTVRFSDAANASTFHLMTQPAVSGTFGLAATVAVASSSGSLHDEAVITITTASSSGFPGVLTLTGLSAAFDGGGASGANIVHVSDAGSFIASSGSPVTVSDANAVGTSPVATFASKSTPGIDATGTTMLAGDLTITEPAKVFFQAGDVVSFTIRDSLGSRDTVGLASPPSASGGGMVVHVEGLNGSTVETNDTGFKVVVDTQDAPNGSASVIRVSNIQLNTVDAPAGPVSVVAQVTTGAASEYLYPSRARNALVGGGTSTSSLGLPVVASNTAAQPVGNLSISEIGGTLKPSTTFSIAIQEAGVTFSSAPLAEITSGDLTLVSKTPTLDVTNTVATWTVATTSTEPTTIVIAPITYDVGAGPAAGDPVDVLASGGGGSSFTTETVTNAVIQPGSTTLFTGASTPDTPSTAGDIVYQEDAGARALTGGSIVLLGEGAGKLLAYRATWAQIPTVTVDNPGSGLVLGTPTINTTSISVITSTGTVTARAESALMIPVTTGSTTPAHVTISNVSYTVGGAIPPGALVTTGAVTSGANGTGASVAGNQFVDATNPLPPGWGIDPPPPPPPPPVYQPDLQVKLETGPTFLGDGVYGTTTGQTVSTPIGKGKAVTVVIEIQNDGDHADTFTLQGDGGRTGFVVKYFDADVGTTDITTPIETGAFVTASVDPGNVVFVRLWIKAKKTALSGTRGAWTITASSVADGTKSDLVKVKAKVA
jgi:hypothetical protein